MAVRDGANVRGLAAPPVSASCAAAQRMTGIVNGIASCAEPGASIPGTGRVIFVSPHDFEPSLDATLNIRPWVSDARFIKHFGLDVATMRADVPLPAGATVDSVTCQMYDDLVGDDDAHSLLWALILANDGLVGGGNCHPYQRSSTTGASSTTITSAQFDKPECRLPLVNDAVAGVRTFKIQVSSLASGSGGSLTDVAWLGCSVRYTTYSVLP